MIINILYLNLCIQFFLNYQFIERLLFLLKSFGGASKSMTDIDGFTLKSFENSSSPFDNSLTNCYVNHLHEDIDNQKVKFV